MTTDPTAAPDDELPAECVYDNGCNRKPHCAKECGAVLKALKATARKSHVCPSCDGPEALPTSTSTEIVRGGRRLGPAPDGDGQAAAAPDPGRLRERVVAALRAAAHSCDGACGLDERTCHEAHPVQEAATTHGVISDLYGPIDAIAEVVMGVRDAEMESLRVERDDALAVADADSKQLAEVDERCDTAAAELRAVRAELDRIAELPTVTCDDGRADRFSTGARWTLRMIREVLNGQEHTQ